MAESVTNACRVYLCIIDALLLVAGVLLQMLAMGLLLEKPMISYKELTHSVLAKGVIFLLGTLMEVTSCVGFSFWHRIQRKQIGCFYFGFLVLGLLLELAVVGICILQVQELSGLAQGGGLTSWTRNVGAKMFRSFATRYEDDNKCGAEHDDFLRALAAESSCHGTPAVECQVEGFAARLSSMCLPKPGHEEAFRDRCSTCFDTFYDTFINGSSYEAKHAGDALPIKAYWESSSGVRLWFCRCSGRALDSMNRHGKEIMIAVGSFMLLHVLLLASVAYLLCCRSRQEQELEEEDEEVELPHWG